MPVEASASSAPSPVPPEPAGSVGAGTSATDRGTFDAPPDVGLAGLRTHLDRVVHQLGLRSLTVVVDDPDLGRQAFRAGAGALDAGTVSAGPGAYAEPALPPARVDAALLVALCAASLRVDVLRDTTGASLELALRRLPGVYGVVVEPVGDATTCRVLVRSDAPDDLARRAADTLGARHPLVIELVRDAPMASTPAAMPAPAPVPTVAPPVVIEPEPEPEPETQPVAERETAGEAATMPAEPETRDGAEPTTEETDDAGPVLLAVRTVPEDGEIEVHLADRGARAIGRARLGEGLVGAAEAVLAAARQIDTETAWTPAWVRPVETTADGTFVVAVALSTPGRDEPCHGIADATSPIEAAAKATVAALAEA